MVSANKLVGSGHAGPPGRGAGGGARPPPRLPPAPPMPRAIPAKSKVISILERARTAMEGSYPYEDPYAAAPEPPVSILMIDDIFV